MADFSKLKRRTLGAPPPIEDASTNLDQPELAATVAEPHQVIAPAEEPEVRSLPSPTRRDGRSLRRSNRVVQFATRVTPDFDYRVRDIAEREGLLIVEVLERALDLYESKLSTINKKAAR